MSINQVGNRVLNWAQKNLTGEAGADFKSKNAEANQIDDSFHQVQDGLDQVKSGIDGLDKQANIRPPSLSNVKDSEIVALSAGTGAVLGAAGGLGESLISSAVSAPKVDIVPTQHEIDRPSIGHPAWNETRSDITEMHGNTPVLKGWDIKYTPAVTETKVGSYTTNEAHVTQTGHGSPLADGLTGMAVGTGLGALAGAAVVVARHATGKSTYQPGDRQTTEGDGAVIVKAGAAGGAIGAVAGLANGLIEASHNKTVDVTNQAPVYEHNVKLADIPNDYPKSALAVGPQGAGTHPLNVDMPKTNLFGHAETTSTTQHLEVQGRFGLVAGTLGGLGVGTVSGVVAGVMLNIFRKII